jgi:hypothetical protein
MINFGISSTEYSGFITSELSVISALHPASKIKRLGISYFESEMRQSYLNIKLPSTWPVLHKL